MADDAVLSRQEIAHAMGIPEDFFKPVLVGNRTIIVVLNLRGGSTGYANCGRKTDWDGIADDGESRTFQHKEQKMCTVTIASDCKGSNCLIRPCSTCRCRLSRKLKRFREERERKAGAKQSRPAESQVTPAKSAAGACGAPLRTPLTEQHTVGRAGGLVGDPNDPSTWKARKGKGTAKLSAWNPIAHQWVKPVSKGRGRPTRDTLGKVWLDWAGEYVESSDPRAQPQFVNPSALREMEIRLEKEQDRLAKLQSCADVQPHKRPTDPFGRVIVEPATPAPLSEYRARHDEYLQNIQYGPLVHSNVSDVPPTQLERALGRVGKHKDEPRLSALNARRIELYEYKLEQMDLMLCTNCSRLRLVDVAPSNTKVSLKSDVSDTLGSTQRKRLTLRTQLLCVCSPQDWCCDTCCEDCDKLSAANHMDPAPKGRPLTKWQEKLIEVQKAGDDVSWLPPKPPAGAHYPPVYYTATLAETLLVTRFRTVMCYRHMPLYHKKFRGRTPSLRIESVPVLFWALSMDPLSTLTQVIFPLRFACRHHRIHAELARVRGRCECSDQV
jgi:hypothetical protein